MPVKHSETVIAVGLLRLLRKQCSLSLYDQLGDS